MADDETNRLAAKRGDTFLLDLSVPDKDGGDTVLTNYSVRMEVRTGDGEDAPVEFALTSEPNGGIEILSSLDGDVNVRVRVDASTTQGWTPGEYLTDIQITSPSPDNIVYSVPGAGKPPLRFTVTADITRPPAGA